MPVHNRIADFHAEMTAWRRDFHEHPELAFEEVRTSRVVAEKLSKKWGKPVIVENKPGADGFIAIDTFKRGATDGHDLIQLDNAHLVIYPHLFKKLPYDPVKDFDPIAPLFKAYFFVGVSANSKYKTVGDIVADAKAHPGALNYGSWSVGNPVHLGSALLESLTGTELWSAEIRFLSQLPAKVEAGDVLSVVAMGLVLSFLATIYPAWRAARLDPVEALRYE